MMLGLARMGFEDAWSRQAAAQSFCGRRTVVSQLGGAGEMCLPGKV